MRIPRKLIVEDVKAAADLVSNALAGKAPECLISLSEGMSCNAVCSPGHLAGYGTEAERLAHPSTAEAISRRRELRDLLRTMKALANTGEQMCGKIRGMRAANGVISNGLKRAL